MCAPRALGSPAACACEQPSRQHASCAPVPSCALQTSLPDPQKQLPEDITCHQPEETDIVYLEAAAIHIMSVQSKTLVRLAFSTAWTHKHSLSCVADLLMLLAGSGRAQQTNCKQTVSLQCHATKHIEKHHPVHWCVSSVMSVLSVCPYLDIA